MSRPSQSSNAKHNLKLAKKRREILSRFRRPFLEPLEDRRMLEGSPWHNTMNANDANQNWSVEEADSLAIANIMSYNSSTTITVDPMFTPMQGLVDVNDDWVVDINDYNQVVSQLWPQPASPFVPLSLSVDTASAYENSGSLTFNVHRNGGVISDSLYATFYTSDGTANGMDYYSSTGSFYFNAGQTDASVTIILTNDDQSEGNETFYLNVTSTAPNSSTVTATGQATILNDDSTYTLSNASAYEDQGYLYFNVHR